MRLLQRQFPVEWLLLVGLLHPGPTAPGADRQPGIADDRMPAIVAAVRAEETKYRNIEYVTRIVIRDSTRKDPNDPADVTTLATRRVVLQGDWNYLRYQAHERTPWTKFRWELVSAYDGERTRTVTTGNCVNIHRGRFMHPDSFPAHSLPLAHVKINFPLSVYLSGTKAIRAHLKYPQELIDTDSMNTFAGVEPVFEGEEPLDGLRCLKVRLDRSVPPHEITQFLWLAPERNFHCVQEQYVGPDKRVWHEMRVRELRESSPGVWFPMRITVSDYDHRRPVQQNPVVITRTEETTVLKVDLAPHHENALFRDVPIPADLPSFEIKDRTLIASTLPEPSEGDEANARLLELARRVADQERRYEDIEVKAHVRTNSTNPQHQWVPLAEGLWEDRSIVRGELAYHTTNRMQAATTGWQRSLYQAAAFDGRWSRTLSGYDPQNPQGLEVILRRGGVKIDDGSRDGIFVYRPHNLMLRDMWIFSSLAGLLASPRYERGAHRTLQFRYCGTADVDGHPCIKVRGDFKFNDPQQPSYALVLYLATDRNHIPIKLEHYAGNEGNRLMPIMVCRCDDFREIAPGLWYPFRLIELAFELGTHMGQGWILLNWRRDYLIDSVTRSPKVDEAVFSDVIAPAGAQVQVRDEEGQTVGQYRQAEAGIPSLTPAGYLQLLNQGPADDDVVRAKARGRAKKGE